VLEFKDLAYVPAIDKYVPVDQVPEGEKTLSISGTKFRKMMNAGDEIPEWFSHPNVIKILRVRAAASLQLLNRLYIPAS
jgi:sulfate adenylyltransferase